MSRNNGYVHVHTDVAFNPTTIAAKPAAPKVPLAPIEIRDAVYQELIRLSPATRYRELIYDDDGLKARGLGPHQFDRYGALPPTQEERAELAHKLRIFVWRRFPAYARQHPAGVIGIPGFWLSMGDKRVQIWKPTRYNKPALVKPALVIPYRDAEGRIQACQIRLHKDDIPEGEKRYRWLSSPREPRGCSSGTPIHFTFSPATLPAGSKVVITEGALKADVFVHFRESFAIATSGVSCSHDDLVTAAAPYHALIAFDADYKTNPNVCRQLAHLIAIREQRKANPDLTTRIVYWDKFKGIDDAAQHDIDFQSCSITQWFRSLSGPALKEVEAAWHDLKYSPAAQ